MVVTFRELRLKIETAIAERWAQFCAGSFELADASLRASRTSLLINECDLVYSSVDSYTTLGLSENSLDFRHSFC
jgi:hypothetical protein